MKFKKLLSSTLLAATVLTAVAGGAGASAVDTNKAEVTQVAAGYAVKSPYATQINNMIELGAIEVKKGAKVDAKATVTRAELAYAIGMSEYMLFDEGADYKAEMVKLGFVDASYDWNKTATRGDAFELLGKVLLKVTGEEGSTKSISHITDITKLDDKSKEAINHLVEYKIVTGNGGKMSLDKNITLEHLCKILDAYLNPAW